MKNFWKTVGAVVVGLIIVRLVIFFFAFSIVGALGSSSSEVTEVPANAILNINMADIAIVEQSSEANPFDASALLGYSSSATNVGILDAVKALEAAANDPKIKCIYLRPDMAGNVAHLEEFRAALKEFRSSGKAIYAYMESPTNAGYYLASVADRIYMAGYHGGMIQMVGLSAQLIYYKDLLDLLGVKIQLIRHGKYKSAGEPYIRSTASAENLEQQRVMVSGVWNELVSAMVEKSGKTPEEFNQLIDNLELKDPQAFLDKGLVDELVTLDGMKSKLCAMAGVEKYNQVQSIGLSDYARLAVKPDFRAHDAIAIIYADGEIVDGYQSEEVAGKRFADIVNKVREDESVKAVVLRVNSPGGSVIGASHIKDAVDSLCAEKPVIASYGEYAASGGYWISANCNYIFSDATTLTGSIGVFGMIPDLGGAAKKLAHLNIYNVNSNKHSDMYGMMRGLTAEEQAYIQSDIENVYTEFTTLVAKGRNMTVQQVDDLGQGRVWTGRDAIANGLVDEIGGLKDALEYTARQAGLSTYRIDSYPKPASTMDLFISSLQPSGEDLLVEGIGIPRETVKAAQKLSDLKKPAVYVRIPYIMDIK